MCSVVEKWVSSNSLYFLCILYYIVIFLYLVFIIWLRAVKPVMDGSVVWRFNFFKRVQGVLIIINKIRNTGSLLHFEYYGLYHADLFGNL